MAADLLFEMPDDLVFGRNGWVVHSPCGSPQWSGQAGGSHCVRARAVHEKAFAAARLTHRFLRRGQIIKQSDSKTAPSRSRLACEPRALASDPATLERTSKTAYSVAAGGQVAVHHDFAGFPTAVGLLLPNGQVLSRVVECVSLGVAHRHGVVALRVAEVPGNFGLVALETQRKMWVLRNSRESALDTGYPVNDGRVGKQQRGVVGVIRGDFGHVLCGAIFAPGGFLALDGLQVGGAGVLRAASGECHQAHAAR